MMVSALVLQSIGQDQVADTAKAPCYQKDMSDVIRSWLNKPPKLKVGNENSLFLVPAISSNPATGFMFGVAGQYVFKGKNPGSLYSSINGSANFTTLGQFLFQVKNNIFLKNNNVFLSGDWRIFLFSQSTYGLGTNAPEGGVLHYQYVLNGLEVSDDSLVQPMEFNHIRFHQTVNWNVKGKFYVGFGYHLDWMNKIKDLKLDTLKPLYTSHYLYSKKYDFSTESYLISGLSLNLVYDTRDNMVNPYKGFFANVNWRLNPEFLGSEFNANMLNIEWRSFHGLSKKNPRHLIGFWLLGNFSESGRIPYLILPALGYDQRGRSGRGYTQGRFRGTSHVYAETEYRFPISRCTGLLGGVLFANVTTTSQPGSGGVKLFDYMAPGYGFGLRLMVDKNSRTNLQVDFGFGKKSAGIYFGASETF